MKTAITLFFLSLLSLQTYLYKVTIERKDEEIRKLRQDVRRLQPIEETIYFLEDEKD